MARSTRGLVALLAAAVRIFPAIAPPPARAASLNVNGQIAFLRDGAIWLMQPDGSGQTALPIGEYVYDLALSPDGRRIAWQDGQFVRVANVDGTNVLTLGDFDGGINRGLSWSTRRDAAGLLRLRDRRRRRRGRGPVHRQDGWDRGLGAAPRDRRVRDRMVP